MKTNSKMVDLNLTISLRSLPREVNQGTEMRRSLSGRTEPGRRGRPSVQPVEPMLDEEHAPGPTDPGHFCSSDPLLLPDSPIYMNPELEGATEMIC